mmetsp:Transcript_9587/g.23742  ORF Transcript_9587/g.23742 Transcript_9587/m.23742 type:complete len:82 (-) Transcript_9587:49-294(-)
MRPWAETPSEQARQTRNGLGQVLGRELRLSQSDRSISVSSKHSWQSGASLERMPSSRVRLPQTTWRVGVLLPLRSVAARPC